MPVALPYLPSNKNVGALFSKISSAKMPDKFTHEFLHTTIGLKGSNDRALIPLLRSLGFLDQSSTPTKTYRLLKNADAAKGAIAQAIRIAYAPLFEADEKSHSLSAEKLKGLVAQVAGTDEAMTTRIVQTFNALAKQADFAAVSTAGEARDEDDSNGGSDNDEEPDQLERKLSPGKQLRPEFHYNIQVHLPSNATEEVYLNIFNALRKSFQ